MKEHEGRRDPYNTKQTWETWRENNTGKLEGISAHNSKIILQFLKDMEQGQNVGTKAKKGERSYNRLISLKDRVCFLTRKFDKPIDKLTKDDVHEFFTGMRKGKIVRKDGKPYQAVGEYVKDFKTVWGWMRRTGKVKEDITEDLARKDGYKPAWVYLDEQQFKTLANRCNADYKALIWFMLDTGSRVTEAYSVKVSDFSDDFTKLSIRKETSKTIPRTINLKLCSSLIKEFVQFHNLKMDDFLFNKKPSAFNKYLRELSQRVFGNGKSKAGEYYSHFTLYDIRHNASCYWLKRYPKTTSLMYRMGWTTEKEVRYYSEFLGMSDQLQDEDMILGEDKTKIQRLEDETKKLREEMKELIEKVKVYGEMQRIKA